MALTDVWRTQVGRRKRPTAWKVEENVASNWEESVQNSRQSRDREAHAGSRSSDLAGARQGGLCRPGGVGSSEALLGSLECLPGRRVPSGRPMHGPAEAAAAAAGGACLISEDAREEPCQSVSPFFSQSVSLWSQDLFVWFSFPSLFPVLCSYPHQKKFFKVPVPPTDVQPGSCSQLCCQRPEAGGMDVSGSHPGSVPDAPPLRAGRSPLGAPGYARPPPRAVAQ